MSTDPKHFGGRIADAQKELVEVLRRHELQAVVVFFDAAGGHAASPVMFTLSGDLQPELLFKAAEVVQGPLLALYQNKDKS